MKRIDQVIPVYPVRAVKSAPRKRPSVDQQVAIIVDMMTAGEWRAGASHRDLSRRWSCSLGLIKARANEAGRVIAQAVGRDPEAIRGALIAEIELISQMARKQKKPDFGASVRAIELKARLLRMFDPSTAPIEVREEWRVLTAEEKRARIVSARQELDALEAAMVRQSQPVAALPSKGRK